MVRALVFIVFLCLLFRDNIDISHVRNISLKRKAKATPLLTSRRYHYYESMFLNSYFRNCGCNQLNMTSVVNSEEHKDVSNK